MAAAQYMLRLSLQTGNNDTGILDGSLDFPQEKHRLTSIDDSVIVSQSDVHHGAYLDLKFQLIIKKEFF